MYQNTEREIDKAKKIYKAAYLDGLSRLSSRDVLVASSVYYACISQRCPRSLSEVAAISSQSAKKIGKMFQVISKSACSGGNSKNGQSGDDPEGVSYADDDDDVCGLPLPTTAAAGGRESQRAVVMSRVLPEDVVSRLASLLHLPGPLICTARDVCAKVTKLQLADGVSPQAVAAAVIVLVVLGKYKDSKDEKALRSLDNICIVSFCAMSAIQRAYGLLRPHCLLILPPDFVKSIGGIQHISVDMPRLI